MLQQLRHIARNVARQAYTAGAISCHLSPRRVGAHMVRGQQKASWLAGVQAVHWGAQAASRHWHGNWLALVVAGRGGRMSHAAAGKRHRRIGAGRSRHRPSPRSPRAPPPRWLLPCCWPGSWWTGAGRAFVPALRARRRRPGTLFG